MSGYKARKRPYEPILTQNIGRVPACSPYRGKFDGESDDQYLKRLEEAYEAEFQRLGPDTVAAFWAEPVVVTIRVK